MPNDPLKSYLDTVQAPDEAKAAAWDAYHGASDSTDFVNKMKGVSLPDNVKGDLWEGRFGKGFAPARPPGPGPNPSTTAPAPVPTKGFLGSLKDKAMGAWDYINQPILGLKDTAKNLEAYAAAGPGNADVDFIKNHPTIAGLLGGAEGEPTAPQAYTRLGAGLAAGAIENFATPMMVATEGFGAVAGRFAKLTQMAHEAATAGDTVNAANYAAQAAKLKPVVQAGTAATTGATAGFVGQAGYDVATEPGRQPNESTFDYQKRIGGDLAGVILPVTGHAVGHFAGEHGVAEPPTVPTPEEWESMGGRKAEALRPQNRPGQQTAPAPVETPQPSAVDTNPALPASTQPTPDSDPATTLPGMDRRQDSATRQKIANLSSDEMRQMLLTSEKTGLPNRRAFDESDDSSVVGMSDADGLKALNDKYGYDAGDAMLKAKADALKEAGVDAYHDKGDEFLYRGDNPEVLKQKLETAKTLLQNKDIPVTRPDGTQTTVRGADFSYGLGSNLDEAEGGLKQDKVNREASGLRARGELKGITEAPEGLSPGPNTPADALSSPGHEALEQSMRPLVGRVMRLKQLQTGERASAMIDEAIHRTNVGDAIGPQAREKLSGLLGEEVKTKLTDDQVDKLEARRGGQLSAGATPYVFANEDHAKVRMHIPADDNHTLEDLRNKSLDNALRDINDPNISEDRKAKLQAALEDQSGKVYLYLPGMKYPKAEALPEGHPEAPFTSKKFGSDIVKHGLDSIEAATGRRPDTTFFYKRGDSRNPITDAQYAHLDSLHEAAYGEAKAPEIPKSTAKTDAINPMDRPVPDDKLEEAAAAFGIDPVKVRGYSLNEMKALSPGLNPSSSDSGMSSIRQVTGAEGEDAGKSMGTQYVKEDRTTEIKTYEDEKRRLQNVALDKITKRSETELKAAANKWNQSRGNKETALTKELRRLDPDVQKLLPKELFKGNADSETKRSRSTANIEASKTESRKRSEATRKTTSSDVLTGTGSGADKAYTNLVKLRKQFPEEVPNIEMIADAILDRDPKATAGSKKTFANALEVFTSALEAEDPYALKKAVEAAKRTGEQGALGPDISNFTPEEARMLSADAASKKLDRYEKMGDITLKSMKESVNSDDLRRLIEQSTPVGPINEGQQAVQNELFERYTALLDRAGPSESIGLALQNRFTATTYANERKANVKRDIRVESGKRFHDDAIVKNALNGADKLMDSLTELQRFQFMDDMENGRFTEKSVPENMTAAWKAQGLPDLVQVANMLRDSLDAARERVHASSGSFEYYMENYVPHIWTNIEKGRNMSREWIGNNRGLGGSFEGTTSFMKEREHQYIKDGQDKGLQLVTSNPVRLSLIRIQQLNQYAMAHEIFNKIVNTPEESGAMNIPHGQVAPANYKFFNDPMFKNKGGGNWAAPTEVVRAVNNFASQGLRGKLVFPIANFSTYDALRSVGNLANQFQLSISAFHGVETAMNSAFTAQSVGIQKMLNQKDFVGGIASLAKGLTILPSIWEDYHTGKYAIANFGNPDSFLDYSDVSNAIERANGRVESDPEFRLQSFQRMKDSWKTAMNADRPAWERLSAAAKTGTHIVGTVLQATSYPIMQVWVPRLKIGAFAREARNVYSEYQGQPQNIIDSELQKRWDSIDNRFGEVVYENLFMNKITKDILSVTMRSPGWNIGTAREGLGAVKDAYYTAKTGKVTTRQAYVASMVASTMMFGAIYTYLHTGDTPKDMADYFFPRDGSVDGNGQANRVFPKNYVYDYISMYHSFGNTLLHKAAPTVSTMGDLWANKDFYGREIRDPGGSTWNNVNSTIGYLAGNLLTPFTIQNAKESNLRNSNSSLQSAFAILPAPKYIGQSKAETLANTYYMAENPQGTVTEDTFNNKKTFVSLRNDYRSGKLTDDDLHTMVEEGKLDPKQLVHIVAPATDSPLVRHTKELKDFGRVQRVWNAATDEEKKKLLPVYTQKAATLLDENKQEPVMNEIEKFMDSHPDM